MEWKLMQDLVECDDVEAEVRSNEVDDGVEVGVEGRVDAEKWPGWVETGAVRPDGVERLGSGGGSVDGERADALRLGLPTDLLPACFLS